MSSLLLQDPIGALIVFPNVPNPNRCGRDCGKIRDDLAAALLAPPPPPRGLLEEGSVVAFAFVAVFMVESVPLTKINGNQAGLGLTTSFIPDDPVPL